MENKTYTIQEMRDNLFDIMESDNLGEYDVEFNELALCINRFVEKSVTVTMLNGEITNHGFCKILVECAKLCVSEPGIVNIDACDYFAKSIVHVQMKAGKIISGYVRLGDGTVQEFENGEQPNLKQISVLDKVLSNAKEALHRKPNRVLESTYRTAIPILQELLIQAELGFNALPEIEEYEDVARESYHDANDYEESCVFENMVKILRDISLEMDE